MFISSLPRFGALPSTTAAVRNSVPVLLHGLDRMLGQAVRARTVVGRGCMHFSIQFLKHVQKLRQEKTALVRVLQDSRARGNQVFTDWAILLDSEAQNPLQRLGAGPTQDTNTKPRMRPCLWTRFKRQPPPFFPAPCAPASVDLYACLCLWERS